MLRKVDKISKIVAIVLLVAVVLSILGTSVFAAPDGININPSAGTSANNLISDVGSTIVGIIRAVGYVIAIVMLMYIGIKYLTSSPDGKAEVKNKAIIFIGGALLLVAAVEIVNLIFSTGESISITGTETTPPVTEGK